MFNLKKDLERAEKIRDRIVGRNVIATELKIAKKSCSYISGQNNVFDRSFFRRSSAGNKWKQPRKRVVRCNCLE